LSIWSHDLPNERAFGGCDSYCEWEIGAKRANLGLVGREVGWSITPRLAAAVRYRAFRPCPLIRAGTRSTSGVDQASRPRDLDRGSRPGRVARHFSSGNVVGARFGVANQLRCRCSGLRAVNRRDRSDLASARPRSRIETWHGGQALYFRKDCLPVSGRWIWV